ncbi:MAG: LysE family transporter [Chitinophagales bacterium]
MSNLELIVSISLIHLGAVMSPGPDFIVVVKNALTYSRKIGVYTAVGIGFGIIVHILYTFLGIGILIKESSSIYRVLKYIGAVYIVYIGVMSFVAKTSKQQIITAEQQKEISNFKAFRIGFITNALNVKASMFFLGLFTTMISPETNKNVLYFLAVLLVFQTIFWFILVSHFFSRAKIQEKYFQYENVINKIFGLLLILLALKILFF